MLETVRLTLAKTTAEDLAALLPVYQTNRQFLTWSFESPDLATDYGLAQLQNEWQAVQYDSSREMWLAKLKSSGQVIATIDFLEQNPSDNLPWLGLLLVHGDFQGQGYGQEIFQSLVAYYRDEKKWTNFRLSVLNQNKKALAFWQKQGCQLVAKNEKLTILEYRTTASET